MKLPLADVADRLIARLAAAADSAPLAALDGATLLGERAMLRNMRIPRRTSAGRSCGLYGARGGTLALNLARTADRDMLPALFETEDTFPSGDDRALAAAIARGDAAALVTRGRSMGLAIAWEHESPGYPAGHFTELITGHRRTGARRGAPRVVDLSALWAGPLAAHLLMLAGATVVKVESRTRPDAMRSGDPTFYALLNQGKSSVALNLADSSDRRALLALIADADIVIEAARPRALEQLGIDAAQIVRTTPGLAWLTITAHGVEGDAGGWVGFGDDCGVAGGLTAALRAASGQVGFVGDAIADPLTGIWTALTAWEAWISHRGGRFGMAMSQVVARCLAEARNMDRAGWESSLKEWSAAVGKPFPLVTRRPIGALHAFGQDTRSYLQQLPGYGTHAPISG
jgi:CoA-transferase family III